MRLRPLGKRFYEFLTAIASWNLAIRLPSNTIPFMRNFLYILFAVLVSFSANPLMADESAEPEVGKALKEMGTRIDLPGGDKLQLHIDKRKIIGRFVDAEGLLIEPTAESILFIIDQPGHRNDEWRTVLRVAEDAKMVAPRSLTAPYKFRARLIIRFTDGTSKTIPNASLELDKEAE
jgi:hypothetical protein